jgi:hypothetical protein
VSDSIVNAFHYKDTLVFIHVDDDPQDPRVEWDNSGIFWGWHSRYKIGDPGEVERYGKTFYKKEFDPGNYDNFGQVADAIYKEHRALTVLPVRLHDHGGLSLSISSSGDRWDSGQLGLIWMPREGLADLGYKIASKHAVAKAEKQLHAEIEVMDAYVSGRVYGWESYVCVSHKDEYAIGPAIDATWGYYGHKEIPYMLEVALGSSAAAKAAVELGEHAARRLRRLDAA